MPNIKAPVKWLARFFSISYFLHKAAFYFKSRKIIFFSKKDFSLNFSEFFRSSMSALLQNHHLLNKNQLERHG